MTEYWVSQGNKWCDFCKIYISNNPSSIRNHELGQRHKDSVSKRLNTMREEKATKDKEQKQAARVVEQIEAKANKSYQKDLATFQEARDSNAQALAEDNNQGIGDDWELDSSSGYYYNKKTNCYYDSNSGFYYTEALGKWVTQEEALAASQIASGSIQKKPSFGKPQSATTKSVSTSERGPPPGRVVSTPLNPMRTVKGAKSSVAVKRKSPYDKTKAVSKEEADALKAREAAKKRVEDREKSLLGLYKR
ncbi:hypothetical protein RD792_016257 [Penstemon davidsonii]|uniref:Matrin-type domain-containing protein n=1 Tax=Penstemon davidsonii TaxID=160366 RepID=A0ABR0CK08_9LAMI|nr:hypothetical protein RD792_016257 [Penstemon davidsonii]